ncbi:hypothetical protein Pyn_08718 [Prunus yedoensis var. nudiflora]|uniref:Uncharacterized protein n=1 Tax=Prunus yedoensis var. nudiflora TaxID=2094558 RepID=A0A315B3W1_PRUYE|nr:hypothetical protein Pyn_08718 [Prunus yedoensis var. nudiflora]
MGFVFFCYRFLRGCDFPLNLGFDNGVPVFRGGDGGDSTFCHLGKCIDDYKSSTHVSKATVIGGRGRLAWRKKERESFVSLNAAVSIGLLMTQFPRRHPNAPPQSTTSSPSHGRD